MIRALAVSWMVQFHRDVWRADGTLNVARTAISVAVPFALALCLWLYVGTHSGDDDAGELGAVVAQALNDMQLFITTAFAACIGLTVRAVVGVTGAVLHGPEAPAKRRPAKDAPGIVRTDIAD
jgi:hypothetical protein